MRLSPILQLPFAEEDDPRLPFPTTVDEPRTLALEKFTIPRFATAAARDTAIPSPVPGMHCFLLDKQSLQFVDSAGVWRRYSVGLQATLAAPSAVPGNSALAVTFPAGAFGGNPYVAVGANSSGSQPGFAFVGAVTNAGLNIYWHQLAGTAASRVMYAVAVNSATTALARAADYDGPLMTVTCPHPGCENQGIPLLIAEAPAAQCGPCGTDLTTTIEAAP